MSIDGSLAEVSSAVEIGRQFQQIEAKTGEYCVQKTTGPVCCMFYYICNQIGCWLVVVGVLRLCPWQRRSELVTPGDTAVPGMTSLKDGELQHSSALVQSPKEIWSPNHPSEINPNSDSRLRSDDRSRWFVQYRVDQSQGQRPRSLLSPFFFQIGWLVGWFSDTMEVIS